MHQNFHVSAAYEPKITSSHLLQKLATKALAKVPGANDIIAKHFKTNIVQSDLKPPMPKKRILKGWVQLLR